MLANRLSREEKGERRQIKLMNFTYQVGREDLLSYFRHFYQTSLPGRQLRTRYVGSWTGLYLVVALLVWLYFRTWLVAILAYGIALLLRFVTVVRFDAQVEKTVRQIVDEPKLLASLGERTLVLESAGLREISAVGEVLTPWSKVGNVVVEPERIYVRTATSAATIITRTEFAGPIEFEALPGKIELLRDERGNAQI